MDIYEALYTTRSMRRMKPDPIPQAAQARILDAAIRAPNIGEQWRFILVDDPKIKSQLAPLYKQAFESLLSSYGTSLDVLLKDETSLGRIARSGYYLAEHFADVPLLLIGFARNRDGSGIYPALWSAMLAARAEGIGSALTGVLQSFFSNEVMDMLGAPKDEGWFLHGVVAMGYPLGTWGVARRTPVHQVAARNSWQGDLGFTVSEPLWQK